MTEKQKDFESSFDRLEKILEHLNSGKASLDDSLKLYEEANGLIVGCNKRLNEAEQRVTMLVKNRQGELATDEQGQPQMQPFPTQ